MRIRMDREKTERQRPSNSQFRSPPNSHQLAIYGQSRTKPPQAQMKTIDDKCNNSRSISFHQIRKISAENSTYKGQ